jgi:hypothetical protein
VIRDRVFGIRCSNRDAHPKFIVGIPCKNWEVVSGNRGTPTGEEWVGNAASIDKREKSNRKETQA